MKTPLRKKKTLLKSLNLGSSQYRIEYVDKLLDVGGVNRLAGAIDHNQCVIRIDPGADPQIVLETILHEAFHFFLVQYGQEDAINPPRIEGVVETMANGFLIMMRLNPDLLTAIEEL
jgi:hypothetical protein